jgi:hypothetical protein
MTYTEKNASKVTCERASIKKIISGRQEEVSIQLKQENPAVRYLKLQPFYREVRTSFFNRPPAKIVPELRLCGNWLEKAGFLPGEYVSVTVMDGLLVIRAAEELSPEQGKTR